MPECAISSIKYNTAQKEKLFYFKTVASFNKILIFQIYKTSKTLVCTNKEFGF